MAFPTHYIRKRDILHSEKTPAATLAQISNEFLAAERLSDALDFFEKARDADGLKKIKSIALDRGDTFLLARLDRYDRNLITKEEWAETAKRAQAAGKSSMAEFVARKFAPAPAASAAAVPAAVAEKPGEAPLSEV